MKDSNVVELPSVIAARKRQRREDVIIYSCIASSLVVFALNFMGYLPK